MGGASQPAILIWELFALVPLSQTFLQPRLASPAFPSTTEEVVTSQPPRLPDVLVAVDVDSVELVLQVFVLYICHVIDHLQNHKARQD